MLKVQLGLTEARFDLCGFAFTWPSIQTISFSHFIDHCKGIAATIQEAVHKQSYDCVAE